MDILSFLLPRPVGTKVPDGRAEGKDTVHVVGGGGQGLNDRR